MSKWERFWLVVCIGSIMGAMVVHRVQTHTGFDSIQSDVTLLKQRVNIEQVECALCGEMIWKDGARAIYDYWSMPGAKGGILLCPACYQRLQWAFAEKETTYVCIGSDSVRYWYVAPKGSGR